MPRSTAARIAIALAITLIVAGVTVFAVRGSDESKPKTASGNGVWAEGTTWTVKVKQNTGDVAPTEERATDYFDVYDFEVEGKTKDGLWRVVARREDAQGPFAAGFHLFYEETAAAMVLREVALGSDKPAKAAAAVAILGPTFPLTERYTDPPKDATVDGEQLARKNSSLPPGKKPKSTPDTGGIPGGTPGAPPGVPPGATQ